MAVKANPASIRSKKYLVEALMSLMKEKPYDKITIKEITEKAQLSRMTFYTNFKVKDDIIRYYSSELLLDYINDLSRYNEITPYDVAYEFFKFWENHIEIILLTRANNLMVLSNEFEQYLLQLNNIIGLFDHDLQSEKLIRYRAAFVAGGLWNLLDSWVQCEREDSPETMATIFVQISLNSQGILKGTDDRID